MFSQIHYIVRSKVDGKYLVARINKGEDEVSMSYLLVFQENFEALSYLNTHGSDVSDRFIVESTSGKQLKSILQRWDFQGIGLVKDPLLPRIEFLSI
ncbi:conserved hypothetical protein [Crocosphaera subtropica ATCC 51142]|uniref:Uncharacterized protein n=1 Tax=Crocosphaera subtropica (strain ATCC 51142 / BH68) TaxID=43989 RepID=B1WQD5_CROS5|nr:hypothetical protein [Crocosphaera subtropica]ACB51646.1 conserved hypothetical protein [Crocosphaera subtropica ATCC 51142]